MFFYLVDNIISGYYGWSEITVSAAFLLAITGVIIIVIITIIS